MASNWRSICAISSSVQFSRSISRLRAAPAGQAELMVEGQIVTLEPGDTWLVPAGSEHAYRILTDFTAIEATSPPAEVHGRDE
jgi:hypothetical protein